MLAEAKGDRKVEVVLMVLDDIKVKKTYGFGHKIHFLINLFNIDATQQNLGR